MKKIFKFNVVTHDFGKCDMSVTMELKNVDTKPVLSITGNLYSHKFKDDVMGGQCLDHFVDWADQLDPINRNTFNQLYTWWTTYHLNNMHAGTVEQELALMKKDPTLTYASNYDKAVEYLESIGMYEVPLGKKTYKYGSDWLYRPIPDAVLNNMLSFLK